MPNGPWLEWAARLVPIVTIEAVLAWLDIGAPDLDVAVQRIDGKGPMTTCFLIGRR